MIFVAAAIGAVLAADSWLWVVIIVGYVLFSVVGAIATAARRRREQQALAQQAQSDLADVKAQQAVRVRAAAQTVRTRPPVAVVRPAPPAPGRAPAAAALQSRREPARSLLREIEAGRELAAAMIAGVIMGPPAAYRPGGHEPMDW